MINQEVALPKKLRFTKTSRLLVRKEFQEVFNQGKRLNSHSICLYYHAHTNQDSRLGIVIAKRVIPKAVNRNAFKRLIRESFRLAQEKVTGYDLVVLVRKRPDSDIPTSDKMKNDLQQLWQRLPKSPKNAL